MLRNLLTASQHLTRRFPIKIGLLLPKPNVCANYLILNQRYFSNELSQDWPNVVKRVLEQNKISDPTPIQEKTIPLALSGKEFVGIARTGSGKTLAFALPVIINILKEKQNNIGQTNGDSSFSPGKQVSNASPYCVVLAPTRELANQIATVFELFSNSVSTICLVGGRSRSEQEYFLSKKKYDIYVATPGRLNDLVSTNDVNLSNVKYFIVDEADRLLDMGFEPQIRQIFSVMRNKQRQTLMFTATWPDEVQDLASTFMRDFELIKIDSTELKANPNIQQKTEVCSGMDKPKRLLEYIESVRKEDKDARMLIFCNQKRIVDQVTSMLCRHSYKAVAIHGDRNQNQRDRAIELFSQKKVEIMVATDVAARGLDISDVGHVINYDVPQNMEDYVHRIGRTARHNKKGVSYSLITENDAGILLKFIKQLETSGSEIPKDLIDLHEATRFYKPAPEKKRMMNNNRDRFAPYGARNNRFQTNQTNNLTRFSDYN